MLVFMATITWTWWINRQGVVYWHLDPVPFWDVNCSAEKRNRTVHILKNISIVGALTMLQQMAKYESKDALIMSVLMCQAAIRYRLGACLERTYAFSISGTPNHL